MAAEEPTRNGMQVEMAMPETVVVTDFTSPYQIELFNEVEKQEPGRLTVIYLHQNDKSRAWTQQPIYHRALLMEVDRDAQYLARKAVSRAEFAVFNFYTDGFAQELIGQRSSEKRPWCFWGERPGFHHPWLGRLGRIWLLRSLHRCRAAIWGIGKLAVSAYREEFGPHRLYINLPYFSNLERFQNVSDGRRDQESQRGRTILFSGSLIRRKGVDTLARAFAEVARNHSGRLKLRIMGSGPEEARMRHHLAAASADVSFAGFKDWDHLPGEYGAADILCAPSRHDGWGLVVPEGMAAGLPVISTTTTGAAVDLIEHNVNGWLIKPDDEASLAGAMIQVATMAEESLQHMSSQAKNRVTQLSLKSGAHRFRQATRSSLDVWGVSL